MKNQIILNQNAELRMVRWVLLVGTRNMRREYLSLLCWRALWRQRHIQRVISRNAEYHRSEKTHPHINVYSDSAKWVCCQQAGKQTGSSRTINTNELTNSVMQIRNPTTLFSWSEINDSVGCWIHFSFLLFFFCARFLSSPSSPVLAPCILYLLTG